MPNGKRYGFAYDQEGVLAIRTCGYFPDVGASGLWNCVLTTLLVVAQPRGFPQPNVRHRYPSLPDLRFQRQTSSMALAGSADPATSSSEALILADLAPAKWAVYTTHMGISFAQVPPTCSMTG